MTIKDILVALAPRGEADPARDYAMSMAKAFGAYVTGAAYALVPEPPGGPFPEFAAGLVGDLRDEAEIAVAAAKERFEQAARAAGVGHGFVGATSFTHAAVIDFAERLRTSDLGLLTQHNPEGYDRRGNYFLEAALFQSGRPVVIVPRGHTGTFAKDRVLIAWDGSVHAARAVAAAMPLLHGADVSVFTVEERSKGDDFRGQPLVEHLRRHGIKATLAQRNAADIPATIVHEVGLSRSSLVVMGAYGHSRFREFIFGGATRHMLSHMTVPVLMAH